MYSSWVRSGICALAAVALFGAFPAGAAENDGTKTVAEQLNERTKTPQPVPENKTGLSDSAVRVMTSYAFSILPDEARGPDGKMVKLDKSDPKKFLIPVDDARGVIRAAMRSAYAEICGLPELEQQNFVTLMDGEQRRNIWSLEQMQFINALHMFAVSYFTGNLKIKEEAAKGGDAASKATGAQADAFTPKKPSCTPEKKQMVTEDINEYIRSAQSQPSVATPAAPNNAGAN